MKKIVLPIDFSKASDVALKVATEIAYKTHAEVELLHIIEAPYEGAFTTTGELVIPNAEDTIFILRSIKSANQKINKIVDDVRYVGVRFISKIKVGSPYTHFTKDIAEESPDLIIMGTEGSHSFLKGFFNSSNAEIVVTNANCMVLSVKDGLDNFKIRNLVFATNFEDDAPEFVNELKKLQDLFDFKIHLVYITSLSNNTTETHKIEKLANEFISTHKIQDYEFHIIEDLTEYTGITDYAKKVNADIIALSTHQHKGWHGVGGISEDLVNYAEQPILKYKVK